MIKSNEVVTKRFCKTVQVLNNKNIALWCQLTTRPVEVLTTKQLRDNFNTHAKENNERDV